MVGIRFKVFQRIPLHKVGTLPRIFTAHIIEKTVATVRGIKSVIDRYGVFTNMPLRNKDLPREAVRMTIMQLPPVLIRRLRGETYFGLDNCPMIKGHRNIN